MLSFGIRSAYLTFRASFRFWEPIDSKNLFPIHSPENRNNGLSHLCCSLLFYLGFKVRDPPWFKKRKVFTFLGFDGKTVFVFSVPTIFGKTGGSTFLLICLLVGKIIHSLWNLCLKLKRLRKTLSSCKTVTSGCNTAVLYKASNILSILSARYLCTV